MFLIITSIYMLKPWFYKDKMPPVCYSDLANQEVNLSKINTYNKKTYLFYVSPSCEYCSEIQNILDTLPVSKFNRIIVCSKEKNIDYGTYRKKFKLKMEDYFLIDSDDNFLHDFNINHNLQMMRTCKVV